MDKMIKRYVLAEIKSNQGAGLRGAAAKKIFKSQDWLRKLVSIGEIRIVILDLGGWGMPCALGSNIVRLDNFCFPKI